MSTVDLETKPAPLDIAAMAVPLRIDEFGSIRVGKGRITLDLVVEEYNNGMSPEEMVLAYDTLKLPEVYAVIAYFLNHRAEVDAYLERREREAQAIRREIESRQPRITKELLLARREARRKASAPTGD